MAGSGKDDRGLDSFGILPSESSVVQGRQVTGYFLSCASRKVPPNPLSEPRSECRHATMLALVRLIAMACTPPKIRMTPLRVR